MRPLVSWSRGMLPASRNDRNAACGANCVRYSPAYTQPEPDPFQRRHVVLLAPGIGHRPCSLFRRPGDRK
jgi:hypothetical protein